MAIHGGDQVLQEVDAEANVRGEEQDVARLRMLRPRR
jgi:hypothetical protein